LDTFGFLTVLEDERHGYFGGYLVLTGRGRPLEFRCSAPVLPTRAQQILYGPTLRPFLLAEVIGQSLVASAQTPVKAILTDLDDMLELALLRPEEVLCVGAPPAETPPTADPSPTTTERGLPEGQIVVGQRPLRLGKISQLSAENVAAMLAELSSYVDLGEPFERIRTALREAGQIPDPQASQDVSHAAAA
jgi:hypothetical protein